MISWIWNVDEELKSQFQLIPCFCRHHVFIWRTQNNEHLLKSRGIPQLCVHFLLLQFSSRNWNRIVTMKGNRGGGCFSMFLCPLKYCCTQKSLFLNIKWEQGGSPPKVLFSLLFTKPGYGPRSESGSKPMHIPDAQHTARPCQRKRAVFPLQSFHHKNFF